MTNTRPSGSAHQAPAGGLGPGPRCWGKNMRETRPYLSGSMPSIGGRREDFSCQSEGHPGVCTKCVALGAEPKSGGDLGGRQRLLSP